MKLSAFKEIKLKIKDFFIILSSSIKYNLQIELAYPASGWGNIISTFFYSTCYILFIEVIYSNVNEVAGYDKNEMLLFFLLGQVGFYLSWATWMKGLKEAPTIITDGNLDLLLTKPVNVETHISLFKTQVLNILRDSLLPLTSLSILIDWKALNLDFTNIILGIIIAIIGNICFYNITYISVLPSFWLGRIDALFNVIYNIYDLSTGKLPLEGLPSMMRNILTFVIPLIFISSYSVSVITGRSSGYQALFLAIFMLMTTTAAKSIIWNKALKHYTSASS